MEKTLRSNNYPIVSAQPRLHQSAPEIQAYGTVSHLLPLELEEPVRLEMTERLNQLLSDTITLRDLYKKSHWQVAGPTFYQLHLLFDKHFEEQSNLVGYRRANSIARRNQPGHGARCSGDDPHCATPSGPRRSAGATVSIARCAPNYYPGLPRLRISRVAVGR